MLDRFNEFFDANVLPFGLGFVVGGLTVILRFL
jgi:hypothetical protein